MRSFIWSDPLVAHIRSDTRLLARRILRWVVNFSRGVEDIRQSTASP